VIAVYVDDIIVASRYESSIVELKQHLSKKLEIKNLGPLKYCLGIEFSQDQNGITMCQQGYIKDILQRF